MTNVEIFEETQEVNHSGTYWKDGREIGVGFLPRQLKEVAYISAEKAAEYCNKPVNTVENTPCDICVKNVESYTAAREMAAMDQGKVLVLNFANSVHPGGGVRFGARAQEEDLCRKSTPYASLTSLHTKPYYEKHREVRTHLASDAMLISKQVLEAAYNQSIKQTAACCHENRETHCMKKLFSACTAALIITAIYPEEEKE